MQLQLQIFEYREKRNLRTVNIAGVIWFVAKDVCDNLDLSDVSKALQTLDDDEKLTRTMFVSGQNRPMWMVNEPGLYSLVFKSRKPEAKEFKRWVTHEVLPKIRKTGAYQVAPSINGSVPAYLLRYSMNWRNVTGGHFSVISQLYTVLHAKFFHIGYTIPDFAADGTEIRPDVSVGKLFRTWISKHHSAFNNSGSKYIHEFPDGNKVEAFQYPNSMLHLFIDYVDNEWIPNHSEGYLRKRDMKCLPYLAQLLPPSARQRLLGL